MEVSQLPEKKAKGSDSVSTSTEEEMVQRGVSTAPVGYVRVCVCVCVYLIAGKVSEVKGNV